MSYITSRKKPTASQVTALLASAISLASMSAMAQEQQKAVTNNALPAVQVTAEADSYKPENSQSKKFTAPLLDTPRSVAVIPQKLIEDTGVVTLSDALRTVPGITLGAGEGGNPNGDRPFIRGYNSESSIYTDGVRSATSQNREMFAVEQVEVIKGSSSVYGGAGSVGGSINMVSKLPKLEDSLKISAGAGTDDYLRSTLDVNESFENGIAARIAIMGHENNKAGQDDGAEYGRWGAAPSIAFGLGTKNRATLSYYILKTDDIPDSGIPYSHRIPGGDGSPIDLPKGTYFGWKNRDFQKQDNQIGTLKLEHDFDNNFSLSNTAVWSNSDNDYLWTQPDDSQGNTAKNRVWRRVNSRITETETFSNQLALNGAFNTASIKHSFSVGAEYSEQDSDRGNYTVTSQSGKVVTGNATTGACALYGIGAASDYWCTSLTDPNPNDPWLGKIAPNKATSSVSTTTTSVYAFDTLEFNPKWQLNLGVRWDQFETENFTKATSVTLASDTDFVTYQTGLVFKPTENGSVYASFGTSANPVGVDAGDGSEAISATIKDLEPEESKNYEIGTKWNVFNNAASVTAAIFRTEKDNARVQNADLTYANVGTQRVDGVELGISGNLSDALAVYAGYTYMDSELVDNGGTAASIANNGNQFPNTPENSLSLWGTYELLSRFTVGTGATYVDKVYGNAANTLRVPSYVRWDAMANYIINENWNLQLNINNITNELYYDRAYTAHFANAAAGRSGVLQVNFKY